MSKYIRKDLFKTEYNILADIVFGKYKNNNVKWDCDVNKNIILKWDNSCNLNGEEGIICEFNGTGWAGWCKVNKCYLVYNTDIDNNEDIVMKIYNFHRDSIDNDYFSSKLQELEKNRINKNNVKINEDQKVLPSNKPKTNEYITKNIFELLISTISTTSEVDIVDINKIIENIKKGDIKDYITDIVNNNIDVLVKKKRYKKYFKKPRDPNAPKPSLNQYFHFKRIIEPTIKNFSHKEKQKEIGRLWKELSDIEKMKYKNIAIEDKNRYEEALQSYIPSEEFVLKIKTWKSDKKDFLKVNLKDNKTGGKNNLKK